VKRLRSEFQVVFLATLVTSFVAMYAASEYFNVARFSQLFSFQAWDGPGPMPTEAYPNPVGVHFFGDFLLTFRTAAHESPYFAAGYFKFAYLPFSAVVISPLFFLPIWFAFLVFLVLGIGAISYGLWIGLSNIDPPERLVLMLTMCLSGPFLSMLDRGNFSLWLSAFCVIAAGLLTRQRSGVAPFFFGLAAAMKLYPILFMLIFVRRRDYRGLAVGVATFATTTALPLFFYSGGFMRNFSELISQFLSSADTSHAMRIRAYNNSFYSLLGTIRLWNVPFVNEIAAFVQQQYFGLLIAISILILFVTLRRNSAEWQTALAVCSFICAAPQVSAAYVYLLFLVPLGMMLNQDGVRDKVDHKHMRIALWLIAILLVPKGIPLWLPSSEWTPAAGTYAGLVNPSICLFLILQAAWASLFTRRVPSRNQHDISIKE